jgi:lysozyme
MKRKLTLESLELIRHFEGFYAKPYIDPVGIPTIGVGTIAYPNT